MRRNIATKRFRVLAAVWIARVGGRDTLNGIFRFIEANPDWQIVLVQSDAEFTPELVRTAKDKGFDDIIATIPGSGETLAALAETPLRPRPGTLAKQEIRSPYLTAQSTQSSNTNGLRASGEQGVTVTFSNFTRSAWRT